jgi:hypothetical protein
MSDPRTEFCDVAMLLALVTHATNKFYSESAPPARLNSRPFEASFTTTLNDAQRERLHILQAFEDLVQKDQVVATTACKSFELSSELASGSLSASYTLFAMVEEYDFGSDLGDSLGLPKAPVAINNSDSWGANFSPLDTNQGEVVHISGQSYWSSILEDPWKFLNIQAGTRWESVH